MPKSVVSIVRCEDYQSQNVYDAVSRACDLAGGLRNIVKQGDRVLIKPCLLKASPPEAGINTHPEVVRAIIRIVKNLNALPIVGDSPLGIHDTEDVYNVSGMKKVCLEEGIELVKFSEAEIINGIPIAKEAQRADVIISAAKFKTHGLTILSGAVKNMFGVVPGLHKIKCHELFPKLEDFSRKLVEVFSYAKPHFSIIDGVVAMEGNGPATGRLKQAKIILASRDSVSADAVLASIMRIEPFCVGTTKYAHNMGLGNGNLNEIQIIEYGSPDTKALSFQLPNSILNHDFSILLVRMLTKFYRPKVNRKRCTLCKKCITICHANAITMEDSVIEFDRSKCKLCFCCSEACPSNAIYFNHISKPVLITVEKVKKTIVSILCALRNKNKGCI